MIDVYLYRLGGDGLRIIAGRGVTVSRVRTWIVDGYGFWIQAPDGFYIGAGQVSFTSCHADSNSWNRDNPTSAYSGFYVKAWIQWVQLIGCQAYDKQEGTRPSYQNHGFEFAGNNNYCQVIGSTRDNVSGALFEGPSITNSSIQVVGT